MAYVPVVAPGNVVGARRSGRSFPYAFVVPALACAVFVVGSLGYILGSERALFLAIGGLPLLAASIPLFYKAHQELGMWTYAIISVGVGYTLRLGYVYAGKPSEEFLDSFFLRGERPTYFLWPAILVSIGLALMSAMYIIASGGQRFAKPTFGELNVRPARLYAVTGLFALLSLAGFYLFVQGTGGFDIANLSAKRTRISTIDVGQDRSLQTFGELRYLAGLGGVGYMFLLAALLSRGKKLRIREVLILLVYLVIVLLLPFYSSNRADVIAPLLASLVVLNRYGRKLNWRRVVVPGLALMLVFNVMTTLRSDGSIDLEQVASTDTALEFVENSAISRHFADFSKTSHLVQRVPSQLEWKNGSTILAFVVGPIPRSIWPSKPLISSGPIIGQQIYEQRRGSGLSTSGVPPGFFGELYWNFGTVGILVGSVVLGLGLGRANRWTKSRPDIRAIVFFGAGLFSTVSGFLAVGIGFALVELATTWVGIVIMYWMLGRPSMIVTHAPRPT